MNKEDRAKGYITENELKIFELKKENEELREILLEAGAKSHKSKRLYDWYCVNSEALLEKDNSND